MQSMVKFIRYPLGFSMISHTPQGKGHYKSSNPVTFQSRRNKLLQISCFEGESAFKVGMIREFEHTMLPCDAYRSAVPHFQECHSHNEMDVNIVA
jgi:hypothetical protein